MLNFFAIVLIIFIGILILFFKKRSFKKLINSGKFHSVKLKKYRKSNNQFLINKAEISTTSGEISLKPFRKIGNVDLSANSSAIFNAFNLFSVSP